MDQKVKKYIDADEFKQMLSTIPNPVYSIFNYHSINSSMPITSSNGVTNVPIFDIPTFISNLSLVFENYNRMLIDSVEQASKPYTECGLCKDIFD